MKLDTSIQYRDFVLICVGTVVGAVFLFINQQQWIMILVGGVCGAMSGILAVLVRKIKNQFRW